MKLSKILFYLLLLPLEGWCQYNTTIKGIVMDNETQEPIPYVYVKALEIKQYSTTDSLGKFQFKYSNSALHFSFEQLNYNAVPYAIDTIKKSPTELTLLFKLQKKENTLTEVVVPGKREIISHACNILDYDFWGKLIVIINYKIPPIRSEIVLLTEQLDTLSYCKLSFEPESLFKDCLGNMHVLSSDSAYQLNYQNKKLQLLPPYAIPEFQNILGSCYTSTNDYIYFAQKKGATLITNTAFHDFKSKNNSLIYSYINTTSKKAELLFDVMDQQHNNARKADHENEKRASQNNTVYKDPTIFRETIMLDEIYAPLFIINDTALVFDFVNDEINIFKNNIPIQKVKIDFHRTKNWKRLMLYDETEKKFYSKFSKGDKLLLKEINYTNGKELKNIALPGLSTKIKVMNGKVYYLLKNQTENNPGLMLNRMPLPQ